MELMRLPAAAVVALGLGSACGFSEHAALPAGGRVQQAEVSTYGWSRLDLGQEIVVSLAQGVRLADVCRMSAFGRLSPGSTHDDARRLMGDPSRTWTDSWGELWSVYDLPEATVEVGCAYYTSGDTPTSCAWTLHASFKGDPASVLLDQQLVGYLRQAEAAHHDVNTRAIVITTADRQETLQLYTKSRLGPGVYWSDQRRAIRRDGKPKR